MSKTRNSEVLASFVKYCEENPELRFWQALKNWSGCGAIIARYFLKPFDGQRLSDHDTYNWEDSGQEFSERFKEEVRKTIEKSKSSS